MICAFYSFLEECQGGCENYKPDGEEKERLGKIKEADTLRTEITDMESMLEDKRHRLKELQQ